MSAPQYSSSWAEAAHREVRYLGEQQVGLRHAVDGGYLSIHPDAAVNAAKACRDQIDRIQGRMDQVRQYERQSGYGDCHEGQALQGKMTRKWQEALALLRNEQEILENMAQTYEVAGKHYQDTEQAQADAAKRMT